MHENEAGAIERLGGERPSDLGENPIRNFTTLFVKKRLINPR